MSTRFVKVWSLRGGKLDEPEVLGDQDQAAAFSRLRQDLSCDVRVHWERSFVLRMLDGEEPEGRLVPKRLPQSDEPQARVQRLMELAAGETAGAA